MLNMLKRFEFFAKTWKILVIVSLKIVVEIGSSLQSLLCVCRNV